MEEHISIIKEVGSEYIGHSTPPLGHARSIADFIMECLYENGVLLDSLVALGSDGTAVNTGWKGGAITCSKL